MDRQSRIDAFVAEARSYVGCRWRHRGRSRFGVDCIGLVVKSLEAAGVSMKDRLNYGREPWNDGLQKEMADHFGAPIPMDDLSPGDVVTMRGINQPAPGHVGIVAQGPGYLTVIHSYNADANTKVTEHRIDHHWMKRIHEAYRPFK